MLRFLSAIAIFAACAVVSKLLPAGSQPFLKLLLILVSVALVRGRWKEHGFVWPRPVRWWRSLAPGLLLGAIASGGALLFHFDGMRAVMKGYSLPQMIAVIWIWSSLSEEIFCRGWFQSGLPAGPSRIYWSAALFGAMHLSLFAAGVDTPSVLWIVMGTTALGYFCARIREESGSWVPAFIRHAGFNIDGLLGGILYTVAYKVKTGHLPPGM